MTSWFASRLFRSRNRDKSRAWLSRRHAPQDPVSSRSFTQTHTTTPVVNVTFGTPECVSPLPTLPVDQDPVLSGNFKTSSSRPPANSPWKTLVNWVTRYL